MAPSHKNHEKLSVTYRNWGALFFFCFLGLGLLVYSWTVIETARRTTDWLLIGPAAVIGAIAFLIAGVADIRVRTRTKSLILAAQSEAIRPIILIALTVIFACAAPFIGFDLGSAIFILLCLLVQGERTWWKLALASVGGAAATTWVFFSLLMVRLPVLFF